MNKYSFKINKRIIGLNYKPFIVAEMSGNHNGSLERALKIIDKAAACGADAIKLQTYTADTMTMNLESKEFSVTDQQSIWKNKKLYDLYDKAHTPWKWHRKLFKHAKQRNILCFSAPFDMTAVDFLEDLNCPAYKIASFENNHEPLIRRVVRTKKPVIVSTGMASESEIRKIVNIFKKENSKNFMLLKCTSSYPALHSESNLETIKDMRKKFNCEVGLSDHSKGIGSAIASVAYGASLIEKHFTLSKKDKGVDSSFSMDPRELKLLCVNSNIAWESKGKVFYGPTKSEKRSLKYRRSIYFSKNLEKGDIINSSNIKVIRPSFGLSPSYYDKIIGKKLTKSVKKGTRVKLEVLN